MRLFVGRVSSCALLSPRPHTLRCTLPCGERTSRRGRIAQTRSPFTLCFPRTYLRPDQGCLCWINDAASAQAAIPSMAWITLPFPANTRRLGDGRWLTARLMDATQMRTPAGVSLSAPRCTKTENRSGPPDPDFLDLGGNETAAGLPVSKDLGAVSWRAGDPASWHGRGPPAGTAMPR